MAMSQGDLLSSDGWGSSSQSHSREGGLGEVIDFALGFLKRRYRIIATFFVLSVALSVTYLKLTPPTYVATVNILFQNQKTDFVEQQSVLADTRFDNTQLETQIQLLKSKAIANAVINELKLSDDPEFKSPKPPLWSRIRAPLKKWIRGLLGAPPDANIETQNETSDAIADVFESRLSAVRLGYSTVIEISFSSSSPTRAAEIANAIANAYISDAVNAKAEASRIATAWLQDRMKELGQQGLAAEREINTFESQNNIVSADGKLIDEQQVAELNSSVVAARTQTSKALARLNQFESVLQANAADTNSIDRLDIVGSDSEPDPVINTLRQQYLEYARREVEWSARFGANHSAVVKLRTKMHDTRESILAEVRRLEARSKTDYEMAGERQQELEKRLALAVSQLRTTNSAQATAHELESSAKGYRSLFESYMLRYIGQQSSFPIPEARVISPASPPPTKSKPKSMLILALGILGGIVSGAGVGFLREIFDRVFRTSTQVESALELPCLALVPLLATTKMLGGPSLGKALAVSERVIAVKPGAYWAATRMPMSHFSESIRAVRIAVDLNETGSLSRVVGITSSVSNEGKSTIAASLAQLIGQGGKRVIVVDCDFRNPSLSVSFAPRAAVGIVDLLVGKRSLDEVVWRDPTSNIDFLPAVRDPLLQASEILCAAKTAALFNKLREIYDYIIVDLPPLIPVMDVRGTGSLIDCFVLVVEWGQTRRGLVQHALRTSPGIRDAFVGVVMNKADMKSVARYGDSDNSSKYYQQYGYIT